MLVSLEQAQQNLTSLIDGLMPGEELVIVRDDQPVAKLVRTEIKPVSRKPGTLRDKIVYIAEDFDAPLEDFREYME
jgi:antitoxin (DNA-binding transcriptional repressor) of toxin-antitoxin stability system